VGKRLKNTCIYLGVRLLLGLLGLVGLGLARRLGRSLGRLAFRLGRVERRRTLANLALAFPELSEAERLALGRAVCAHLGECVAELVHIHRLEPLTEHARITPESRAVLDRLFTRGQGVVFVTGHLGNWELMARAVAAHGYPVNTIGQRSYDPRFTRLIARFREAGRVNTLWRGEPRLMASMGAVLARNELMGLLIDQDTDVPGVFVPFFGRLAYTPTAAAALARHTGAPLVTGFNHRLPQGGYEITIEELALSAEADPDLALARDTAELTARIERQLRAHPAQWVWMHRRWRTRPPEEGSPP
jgi:Kdo2-lipid IVA lauroyltransferase/acyltransferase